MNQAHALALSTLLLLPQLCAETYYVSPQGRDGAVGKSAATAWQSCEKVNHFAFAPGDIIRFKRGGEWRESLQASASGTPEARIVYEAFGEGPKPKFWGSVLLPNSSFVPAEKNTYTCPLKTPADSALQDHVFIDSTWKDGLLTVTTAGADPRTDGKIYSACVRGNVFFSNRKNDLVARDIVVDETAGQLSDGTVQGYGFRIEGSQRVTLDRCEAYRCGRHHFGVINSSEFNGSELHCEFVHPKTPGGNTFYVNYADENAPVPACSSSWTVISASHLEDGNGGECPFFASHGPRQGPIFLWKINAASKISLMSAPVEIHQGTLFKNASIENFGDGLLVDGVTLLDHACIDQWGARGTFQNCAANLAAPSAGPGNGPTGYSTAILLRKNNGKVKDNVIRFNTLLTRGFKCLTINEENSNTRWYGNIMLADAATVQLDGAQNFADLHCGSNYYSSHATLMGLTLSAWQAKGFDLHSLAGEMKFTAPEKADFSPRAAAPFIPSQGLTEIPKTDSHGRLRSSPATTIGAVELPAK